ncbi:MAG: RIP metalloprotease RseP [Chloroflexota bacterium]
MTVLVGIVSFFLILGALILVHELGHFTLAKIMGVRVDEFGLGFPPRLVARRRGQTLYSLNLIPLGGFVKMLGENGEDNQPDSFGSKAPWKRFLILIAGPCMNLLLALGIFFFTFLGGAQRGLTIITKVEAGSPAAAAHLHVGDQVVAIDGVQVQYFDQLRDITQKHLGQTVSVVLHRGANRIVTTLTPRIHHSANQGAMGVVLNKTVTVHYGTLQSLRMSFGQVGAMVAAVPEIVHSVSQHGGSQVMGPIGIAQQTTDVVHNEPKYGIGTVLQFVALLSANLGVLNLLPIPALDGGRLVFVLLSWVRRRNLNPEVEGVIHLVGMAVLLLLIMVVSYQDIVRWVSGGSF